jgi:exopolyphosphatase/pppGpp-phosphohydrolase
MDTSRARRLAVIGLGSNTACLVIFHAIPGYSYRLVDQVREVVRLREDMTDESMSESAMAPSFLHPAPLQTVLRQHRGR